MCFKTASKSTTASDAIPVRNPHPIVVVVTETSPYC
jgi:hypothetical protein